ncbi:MAG TPA: cytochrome c peroxidase [Candidatus Angelobacter sp.]|nr:cytochrome c peroxidase [Candidatus Angelobacter sp.]
MPKHPFWAKLRGRGIGPRTGFALTALLLAGSFLTAYEAQEPPGITPEMLDSLKALPGGLAALPAVPIPDQNPQNAAKIELGRKLFFDTRLSLDRKSSCATCHQPEKAFTDALPRSRGFQGAILDRNSPTILNAAFNTAQFWDGRAKTLDEQCKGPITSATEMNMMDDEHVSERLSKVPGYRADFKAVFGALPSLDNISQAIAAFERTLVTPGSKFDRYAQGDKGALNVQEKRGLILFFGKAACSECHKGSNFTDNQFYSLGPLPAGSKDLGRFAISQKPEEMGAFKTPSLRNVALTAPYMHDGSLATLEEVVDFYDRGAGEAPNKSKLIYKLNLTPAEKADLIAFLKSLTGDIPRVEKPQIYPDEVGSQGGELHE